MDTTVIDVPNSRAIAKQLLTLAQDPDNQPFIAQEAGCMAGLVSYLEHEDVDVILMSARTLQFLASHPSNKKTMRDFNSLVPNLVKIYTRPNVHPKAKEFAEIALDSLGVSFHKESENDENNPAGQRSAAPQKTPSKVVAIAKPFQSVSLRLGADISESTADLVKRTLIHVSGVISVTLDQESGVATVGTREDKNAMIAAIEAALSDVGVETDGGGQEEGDDMDMPEYANESDYEDDDVSDNAVSRWGVSSLEARLERQRENEERRKAEKSERLIGKVGNALSSASSWLMGW